jgi:hypothetical protein
MGGAPNSPWAFTSQPDRWKDVSIEYFVQVTVGTGFCLLEILTLRGRGKHLFLKTH